MSSNTAYILWYTPGTPSTSQIAWGESPAVDQSTLVDAALVQDHGMVIGGLSPNTTYYFQAVSTDALGRTVYSSIIIKTTKP